LIEIMANEDEASDDLYGGRRGVMELGAHDAVLAQNKLLSQQIENLTNQLQVVQLGPVQASILQCHFCGGNHRNRFCANSRSASEEQLNFMGNTQKPSYFPQNNTYHPHLRNHRS
jgi:hypothetical protein